jgi:hypothetical protein
LLYEMAQDRARVFGRGRLRAHRGRRQINAAEPKVYAAMVSTAASLRARDPFRLDPVRAFAMRSPPVSRRPKCAPGSRFAPLNQWPVRYGEAASRLERGKSAPRCRLGHEARQGRSSDDCGGPGDRIQGLSRACSQGFPQL